MPDVALADLFGFQRPVASWDEIAVASRHCKVAQRARLAWFAVAATVVVCVALAFSTLPASALSRAWDGHALVLAAIGAMFFVILAANWPSGRRRRSFSAIDSHTMVAFVQRSAKTPQHGLICRRFNEIEACRPLLRGDLDAACDLLEQAAKAARSRASTSPKLIEFGAQSYRSAGGNRLLRSGNDRRN